MKGHPVDTGKVILAGAGPGDPELLTVKTARYLRQADVIVIDRLVSRDLLKEYVREDALIIPVGKQCRKDGSTPQETINQILLKHAREGKLVLRLKGGDVSIFSNILDELHTLASNNIPYEIIPGVTAALGAAAYAGMPLTARGYSTAVRFLTWYKQDILDDKVWQDLAATDDTLVFYMSSEPIALLVEKLIANGISKDVWLAVIEQATTPQQKVTHIPIHEYLAAHRGSSYTSPSLIVIGKVAALHQSFKWLPDSHTDTPYFAPVPNKNPLKRTRYADSAKA